MIIMKKFIFLLVINNSMKSMDAGSTIMVVSSAVLVTFICIPSGYLLIKNCIQKEDPLKIYIPCCHKKPHLYWIQPYKLKILDDLQIDTYDIVQDLKILKLNENKEDFCILINNYKENLLITKNFYDHYKNSLYFKEGENFIDILLEIFKKYRKEAINLMIIMIYMEFINKSKNNKKKSIIEKKFKDKLLIIKKVVEKIYEICCNILPKEFIPRIHYLVINFNIHINIMDSYLTNLNDNNSIGLNDFYNQYHSVQFIKNQEYTNDVHQLNQYSIQFSQDPKKLFYNIIEEEEKIQ